MADQFDTLGDLSRRLFCGYSKHSGLTLIACWWVSFNVCYYISSFFLRLFHFLLGVLVLFYLGGQGSTQHTTEVIFLFFPFLFVGWTFWGLEGEWENKRILFLICLPCVQKVDREGERERERVEEYGAQVWCTVCHWNFSSSSAHLWFSFLFLHNFFLRVQKFFFSKIKNWERSDAAAIFSLHDTRARWIAFKDSYIQGQRSSGRTPLFSLTFCTVSSLAAKETCAPEGFPAGTYLELLGRLRHSLSLYTAIKISLDISSLFTVFTVDYWYRPLSLFSIYISSPFVSVEDYIFNWIEWASKQL